MIFPNLCSLHSLIQAHPSPLQAIEYLTLPYAGGNMTRRTQPGIRVLDFRAEKPKKQGHDLEDVTFYEYPLSIMNSTLFPYPIMSVIDPKLESQISIYKVLEVKSRKILSQDMKKPTHKRKVLA